MVRAAVLVCMLCCGPPAGAEGQEPQSRFAVGLRSALVLGAVDLSAVSPAFGDLDYDGLAGPHISGVFFLYSLNPHLRVGFETLTANSDENASTTMNYQAGGPIVELSYGGAWTVSGGVHLGGLIANAMARQSGAPPSGAIPGVYYKGSGGFVGPSAGVGRRFGRNELRLFIKPVITFGDSGDLSGFTAWFGGISYAREL